MKKFLSFVTIIGIFSLNVSPVFAQLGDVAPPPPVETPPPAPTPPPVEPVVQIVTPPADTTAPAISGVASLSLGLTEATLAWTTDELAISHLEYGTTESYGTNPTLYASALLAHAAILTGLAANTTYHYCIHATDLAGNTANSCGHSFTTAAATILTDTTAPNITLVTEAPITSTSATIGFTTSEIANAQIDYGTTAGYGSSSTFDANLALTHSVTLSSLLPSTLYHYRIRTADEIGNETVGPDETFTTESSGVVSAGAGGGISADTTAPVISEVGSISLGVTDASLIWTTNELATSTLEYGTTQSYGSHATIPGTALLAHVATLTGLSGGMTYYYCIRSTDLLGNTGSSCPHSFTTTSASAPVDTTAPIVSLVAATPVGNSEATVIWTTNELASAQVQYGTTASYGSTSDLDPILALTHSVGLTGLSPSTIYHYRIKSTDDSGNISLGTDQTFTTGSAPQVQAQASSVLLSNIETASISTTNVTISWNTDLPADSQIEYGTNENLGSLTTLNTSLSASHSVTITGLAPNTNYIFRVKSKPAGASAATVSGNYEFDTLSAGVPVVAPANIISVSTSGVTSSAATVAWITDKAAASQVEYGITTSYGQSSAQNASMQTSHSISLAELAPSTIYHYRVKSVDEAGNVTYSEDYTFTTGADLSAQVSGVVSAPAAVSTLAIGAYDQDSVDLSWTVASQRADVTAEYDVRYSTAPITGSNFAQATQAQLTPVLYGDLSPSDIGRSYVVAGLDTHTKYYFAIKSKFENSEYSAISNVVSQTTTSGRSMNNESSSNVSSSNASSFGGYGGGSSSGGTGSFEPTVVKAEPADSQVIFSWRNPGEADFVRTVLVRKEGSYPTSPQDGRTIYEGRSETYTDTNVTNGTTYYYAVYSYNHAKTYSSGIRISLSPKAGNKQVQFNESGTEVSALSIQHFTRIYKKGDMDIEVEHLQELLAAEGVYPEKYVTGYFGQRTENALKGFQKKHGLAVTGITDGATQAKLNSISRSEERLEIPGDYSVFATDLKLGNEGDLVRALQKYLVYEGSLSAENVTGTYGKKTQAAVIKFQKNYGIVPPVGYTGYKTRHKMKQLSGL